MDARDDDFGCCGGSDETPKKHTQDCSVHPPDCYVCKERKAVDVVANGDAYEARCAACLAKGGLLARRLHRGLLDLPENPQIVLPPTDSLRRFLVEMTSKPAPKDKP